MGRGVARRDPAHVTPKVKCGCRPCFKSVGPRAGKVPFLSFFGLDMKTEMGIVVFMYLKHSPDYINSKYIWIHGSNSLGSSVFDEIPFLAFLGLHRERRWCGQVGPSPCYSQSEFVHAYQVLDL